jgi:hypothetical protein
MNRQFTWSPVVLGSLIGLASALIPMAAHSKIYISINQAQKLMFGATTLTHAPIVLNDQTRAKMSDASSVSHPFDSSRIWKTTNGEWFVVDEVVGKHEMITYAVGINADGTVKQIEILEYRESYGYEVADSAWRDQFKGKSAQSTIKLNKDIQNISGATLSSKHLTDGVKRVLVMYELALNNHPAK